MPPAHRAAAAAEYRAQELAAGAAAAATASTGASRGLLAASPPPAKPRAPLPAPLASLVASADPAAVINATAARASAVDTHATLADLQEQLRIFEYVLALAEVVPFVRFEEDLNLQGARASADIFGRRQRCARPPA